MSTTRWVAGLIASAVLLVATLVIVGIAVSDDAEGTPGDMPDLTDEQLSELAELLTVSTVSEDAVCAVDNSDFNVVEFDIAAVKYGAPPRIDSDAISTPVLATEPEPARDEIQNAVCEDPLLGVTYLKFIATIVRDELLEKTGIDIVELNTNEQWDLSRFAVSDDQINVLAAGFIPTLDVDNPSDDLLLEGMAKNQEWQKVAAYANTLLDRFELTGIEARMSVVNYHLAVGGLVVGGLPAVEKNPNQEDLPALILSLTEKDQCVPLVVIGFNMGDKRPELFEPPVCETPPVPPVVPPGSTPPGETPPDTTVPPTTPTTPPPDTTVPPTTPTTPPPDTTVPPTTSTVPPPDSTVPPPTCGNKNRWEDKNDNGRIDPGECVPNLPPSGTVPAPPTTPPTATTVQPAPTPPSTAPSDPTPPNVTIVDSTPPPNTYTPPGAVVGTTQPPTTVAPPATPPATAPPGGGSTPSR